MTPQWDTVHDEPRMSECMACSYLYWPSEVNKRCIGEQEEVLPYWAFYGGLPSERRILQSQCPKCLSWQAC